MQIARNASQSFIKESLDLQRMLSAGLEEQQLPKFKINLDIRLAQNSPKETGRLIKADKPKKTGADKDKPNQDSIAGLMIHSVIRKNFEQVSEPEISETEAVELINSLNSAICLEKGGIQKEVALMEAGGTMLHIEGNEIPAITDFAEALEKPDQEVAPSVSLMQNTQGQFVQMKVSDIDIRKNKTVSIGEQGVFPDQEVKERVPVTEEETAEILSLASAKENVKAEKTESKEDGIQTVNIEKEAGFVRKQKEDSELSDQLRDFHLETDRIRKPEFEKPGAEKAEFITDVTDHELRIDVIRQISRLLNGQVAYEKEMVISLHPASLGKISIVAKQLATGVAVSIACESQKTYKLLSDSSEHLGNLMQKRLGEPTIVHIQEKAPDYLQQNRQDEGRGGQGQERGKERQNETDSFVARLKLGLNA